MFRSILSFALVASFTLAMPIAAEAGKKKMKSSSKISASERAKIMERGRALCRKQYGAMSRLYKVDYVHGRFVCSEYHS